MEQQGKSSMPLKCPRCNSLDTKFRYFNNHTLSQPRHYCKTCKRLWTVGGNLRNIPSGGKSRNGKQKKATSARSQSSQSSLPLEEDHIETCQDLTPMAAMVPHNFDTTMSQPVRLHTAGSPFNSYCSNDEISCLDAIQSLIQPDANSLVQPTWSTNSFLQDAANNFIFSTSDACLWNNCSDNTSDAEMDTSDVNVDDWLNIPGSSPM